MKFLPFILTFVLCAGASANPVQKRIDYRRRVMANENSTAVLKQGLKDSDPVIRRFALMKYYRMQGKQALRELEAMAEDSNADVKLLSITILCRDFSRESKELLQKVAAKEQDARIKQVILRAGWPFYRDNVLLKNNPSWDYEVVSLSSTELPAKGWKRSPDREAQGHEKQWFAAKFNDSSWQAAETGKAWGENDGIAWYRLSFKLPPKPDCNALELCFDGIRESAWVWLNGVYLGQHDYGTGGTVSLRLDATKEALWGAENVLAIRVDGKKNTGGIIGPVRYEIMK